MVLTQTLSETDPLNAFNNNIIRFTEAGSGYAVITTPVGDFIITPLNSLEYYFNFIEVFKSIINNNLFADDHVYNNSFDQDTALYAIVPVTINTYTSIGALLGTQVLNYKVTKSVIQIDHVEFPSPFLHKDYDGEINLDVFLGYPFDFSFYLDPLNTGDVTITGPTTNLTKALNNRYVTRMSLIDLNGNQLHQYGTGNDLNLVPGFLSEVSVNIGGTLYKSYINVHETCTDEEPIYLKWLNREGSWDYWLFTKKYKVDVKTRSTGTVESNSENINDVRSIYSNLGVESDEMYTVSEQFLSKRQFNKVTAMVYSPKVYFWTANKFIEVLVVSKLKYTSTRAFGEFNFDIKLPPSQNQTT
jgi:hypothetical protein